MICIYIFQYYQRLIQCFNYLNACNSTYICNLQQKNKFVVFTRGKRKEANVYCVFTLEHGYFRFGAFAFWWQWLNSTFSRILFTCELLSIKEKMILLMTSVIARWGVLVFVLWKTTFQLITTFLHFGSNNQWALEFSSYPINMHFCILL